jgi:hypothetical protein
MCVGMVMVESLFEFSTISVTCLMSISDRMRLYLHLFFPLEGEMVLNLFNPVLATENDSKPNCSLLLMKLLKDSSIILPKCPSSIVRIDCLLETLFKSRSSSLVKFGSLSKCYSTIFLDNFFYLLKVIV